MHELLEIAVLIPFGALFIIFARFATLKGNILEPITGLTRWIKDKKKREFYSKPLFACTICMASIWGSTFYLMNMRLLQNPNVMQWLTFICCLAGVMWVLSYFFGGLGWTFDEPLQDYKPLFKRKKKAKA